MAGAFGDVSQELHNLVSYMAEARLAKVGLQHGRQGREDELANITDQIRRKISTVVVRAQVDALSAMLHMAGKGGKAANKRRV